MAHQYVDEVLRVTDEPPHGATFGRVCAERGIDARAAGAPVPGAAAEIDRVLERIRKLLALAGSDNQHEAETAMRTAHELMLRYNIEHVGAPREFEVAHVGDPTKRSNRVEIDIVSLLAELFFVKVIRIPVYLPKEGRHGARRHARQRRHGVPRLRVLARNRVAAMGLEPQTRACATAAIDYRINLA